MEIVVINFVDIGIENWDYSFDGEIEWICDGSIIKREIISKLFLVNNVSSRVIFLFLSRLLGIYLLSVVEELWRYYSIRAEALMERC